MVSIEKILFGYREVRFDVSDSDSFANILLKSGISSPIRNGRIDISLSKYKRFTKFANGKDFTASAPRGMWAFLLSLRSRPMLLISIAVSTFILLFVSNLVWDIRFEDSDQDTEAYIRGALAECGLDVGKQFSDLDFSRIENECLLRYDDISWININRRGTVAYVKVIWKSTTPIITPDSSYSNIVADRDGIIEQIDVISGRALVKVGDVVRRGDILISGILGTDDNIQFCHARGSVKATVNATLTTFAPKEEMREVYIGEELLCKSIKIFNFTINIFKNYRNLQSECDIINDEVVYTLPSGIRLPIKIYTENALFKESRLYQYSESELAQSASYMLSRQLDQLIGNGEIISLKSHGQFHNSGYTVVTDIRYVCNIGISTA